MSIHYRCRHCRTNIGHIEEINVDAVKLGLHELSSLERTEMIQYAQDGSMYINSICEDCHEALQRNPNFYENDTFIQ